MLISTRIDINVNYCVSSIPAIKWNFLWTCVCLSKNWRAHPTCLLYLYPFGTLIRQFFQYATLFTAAISSWTARGTPLESISGVAIHGSVIDVILGLPDIDMKFIPSWTAIVTNQCRSGITSRKFRSVARTDRSTRGFIVTYITVK
jgi:hypothetical protein